MVVRHPQGGIWSCEGEAVARSDCFLGALQQGANPTERVYFALTGRQNRRKGGVSRGGIGPTI